MKNKWNERYNGDTFFYGKDPNDVLKEMASQLSPQSHILCLAEGEGRNAVFLASLGHFVTAVDQSEIGLEKLQQLASLKKLQVTTIVADLEEFQIEENKWDAIVSIWCHLPSKLRKKVHANCVKGLKPNGFFILEAYTPQQLNFKTGGPDNTDLLMTKHDLIDELAGLNFIMIEEKTRDIHEGLGHNGMSAVVQVLAKK